MDAGLLDVLHDGGDVRFLPVAECVDVDLDRPFEEAVDQHPLAGPGRGGDRVLVVTDLHVAPAKDVGGTYEHGVADRLGDVDGLLGAVRDRPGRNRHVELVAEGCEALTILGQIDGVERRPEDPPTF